MNLLLPVDKQKEEAELAMIARKMASGTASNNPQPGQDVPPAPVEDDEDVELELDDDEEADEDDEVGLSDEE
jgi:hypothetical protein